MIFIPFLSYLACLLLNIWFNHANKCWLISNKAIDNISSAVLVLFKVPSLGWILVWLMISRFSRLLYVEHYLPTYLWHSRVPWRLDDRVEFFVWWDRRRSFLHFLIEIILGWSVYKILVRSSFAFPDSKWR